ncbi:MAG: 2-amino-4-hydroxy-6-hydroxymethyldihydropteridine diphosphokinase [Bacteroidales bacterium]
MVDHTVWVGVGTNLGNRRENLAVASERICENRCRIVAASVIYESEPWGFESENSFYNQCLVLETSLSPLELLESFQVIEREMGRKSTGEGFADRIIDLDILFYDNLVIQGRTLQIPHPKMAERLFVLLPLAEISPGKIHPVLNQPVSALKNRCKDRTIVKRLPCE